MQCDDLSGRLSEAAEGRVLLDPRSRRHVDRCLRCQAELVQYRKLLRTLHSLRSQVMVPSTGLLPEILAALDDVSDRRQLLDARRAAYLGGIAAATAAGVGGAALVFANRSKRRLLAG